MSDLSLSRPTICDVSYLASYSNRWRCVISKPNVVRIFLSYGNDDYASLALRIKCDLEALGHEVWFDVQRLKPGGDWERYIEEGLEFASKDNESGRFLLLMTPHSVRRPEGYCLNELARAYARNLPIIPVMVSTVEPPLSISRLQWLDMRECFRVEQHEEKYAKQLGLLAKALTEKQVPFEGVQQRLLNYLQPINYADDLARLLLRFTGREWVMIEVDGWLASSRRMLWITGEAGVGKSALAAWICNKRPEIAAYHFCRFGNRDRVDARRALFSLAYQLSTQLPVYRDRLNASPLDMTVVETNLPAVFDRLFVSLLTDAVPINDKTHILLIDALDEATSDGSNELASLIGGEFDRLPPWLRVIVTSRPHEQEINSALHPLDPCKLDASRAENVLDMRKYLHCELRPFTDNATSFEDVVEKIVDKSQGLFLYASWVRQELQEGRLTLTQVEEFPRGLGSVYREFFKRYFPDLSEFASRWRPVLEVICACREPLRLDDLASLFCWSRYELLSLTAHFGSLFPVVHERVAPFHQSVRDWLTDLEASGPYYVDVAEGERRLADLALQQYRSGVGSMSAYSLIHAVYHFAACHRRRELEQLLLDPVWIEAQLRDAGVVSLLANYDLALSGHSRKYDVNVVRNVTDNSEVSVLQLVQDAIRLSSHVIDVNPDQFASQVVGRLLPLQDRPGIDEFASRIVQGQQRIWLRPLQPSLHPPGTSLLRTLEAGSVNRVVLSGDGRLAVSVPEHDTKLQVWDVQSGRKLRALIGHAERVYGVALSGDGQLVTSFSYDKTLKVWDVESGRELRTLADHSDDGGWVALSGDGRVAISVCSKKILKVWDVESGRELRALTDHSDDGRWVALSVNGRLAVSSSDHGRGLKVWDLETGGELHTLSGHDGSVNSVAFSEDGRIAVSASYDRTLKVWDLESGRELHTLSGHSNEVNSVALSRSGRLAVSASNDTTVRVWDVESGSELNTLEGHSSCVKGVAVTGDGRLAVSASWDGTLKVWDPVGGRHLRTQARHSGLVDGVAVSADGSRAVTASYDETLKVWDLKTRCELCTLVGHTMYVHSVAIRRDGRRAVSASRDQTLILWDLKKGRKLRTIASCADPIYDVAANAELRRGVFTSFLMLVVWDLETGRQIRTLYGHSDFVVGVAMSADGRLAVSASSDNTLKVWDVEAGCELHTLVGHSEAVSKVAVSKDGRLAISASQDHTVRVWNLENGRELCTLAGHSGSVNDVAVSADTRHLVSASEDNTVTVWDLEAGMRVATFTCDTKATCCAFIGNREVIAGDGGGCVYFLRLEEPKTKT